MRKRDSHDSYIFKRKSAFVRNLAIFVCCAALAGAAVFFVSRAVLERTHGEYSFNALYEQWAAYDYAGVYETSSRILDSSRFNNTALTYRGYAAFYLGVSQLDTADAQRYLDEAVNSLRVALIDARDSLRPQLEYMLGKAYFYKNTVTSYYYSDLAVKYLLLAREHGYKADDMAEYLGMSYAALGMTVESISAFAEALLVRESDSLLLSMAEQYSRAGQNAAAEQYLFRVIKSGKDDALVLKSHAMLGTIYIEREQYADAENEFNTVLEMGADNADAYYGLGVVCEKRGDMVKARAQWRKALRIEPNHPGALKKMADYK